MIFENSLLILLVGVIAGFADSTVGSGGLISIPFLIFLGLPPQAAIATDRLGSMGQTIGAMVKFWKEKKILWEYVLVFTIIALTGGWIGSNLLISLDPKLLQKIIGFLLLILLPLIFFTPAVGVRKIKVSSAKRLWGFVLYFLTMIYNGFFGTGAGPLSTYNSLFFFGFSIIESQATNIIPWFFLSLSSLLIFWQRGIVDLEKGIYLFAGMSLGGYLGAHFIIKIGNLWVKRIFVAIIIVSGAKMLFF